MDAAALDAIRIDLAPGASLIMPALLSLVMLAVALNLHLSDFAIIKRQPRRFLGAAALQLLGLPLLTLGLVHILNPIPSIALGMIVVACCPGGNMSNFFTHLARGDTALSVALTATSSLFAALMTPISILFWTSLYGPSDELVSAIEVDAISFVVQTAILLAVPLALGMVMAHRFPKTAARVRPGLMVASILALVFLVVGGLASNWEIFTGTAVMVLGIAVLHNALAFGLGAAGARAMGMEAKQRRSVTVEVGIQNTSLALIILLSQFDGLGGAAALVGLWSVWHLCAGAVLAAVFRGRALS